MLHKILKLQHSAIAIEQYLDYKHWTRITDLRVATAERADGWLESIEASFDQLNKKFIDEYEY